MSNRKNYRNEKRVALIRGMATLSGINLQDIRREAGVNRTTFHRIITGERKSARVEGLICKSLGISQKQLKLIS